MPRYPSVAQEDVSYHPERRSLERNGAKWNRTFRVKRSEGLRLWWDRGDDTRIFIVYPSSFVSS